MPDAHFFVLRAPLLPQPPWLERPPGAERLASFRQLVEDPVLREALYVASPDLHSALELWRHDPNHPHTKNVPEALYRYLSRMGSRPTPFGLFSACSTGQVGPQTLLDPGQEFRRHTRLDMGYLSNLCEVLEPELRPKLLYSPNSTIVQTAAQYRYAEGRQDPVSRTRHNDQVSLQRTDAIDAVLAAAPARPAALAAVVQQLYPDISEEEALDFVGGLIDAQVLVSPLAPAVTGEDPLRELIGQLQPLLPDLAEQLEQVRLGMEALDAGGLGQPPAAYDALTTLLQKLPATPDPKRLYHVDLYRTGALALGTGVVEQLWAGVELLYRISPPQRSDLEKLAKDFDQRWGEAEVPLALVMDEELGLGFGAARSADPSPLLQELSFGNPPEADSAFTAQHRWMLRRLLETSTEGTWELSDEDVAALTVPGKAPLPESLYVMATLAAPDAATLDRGEGEIHLHSAEGPDGTRLFGRFCLGDARLHAEVQAHMRQQEQAQGDRIVAEVVHLPAGRMGNVIARPRLRTYEIPYLGRGEAPVEEQVPLSDLWLSQRGGRLILRSRRLNREVVPALCSAHNYAAGDLPVYRFLATLGVQGSTHFVGFQWGPLGSAPYLPRVRRGRLILSLARWRVQKKEVEILRKGGTEAEKLRSRLRLPRHVRLAEGDNLLWLDLDCPLAREALTGKESAVFMEIYPGKEELCVQSAAGGHRHELLVPFLRPGTRPPVAAPPPPPQLHLPGSDWLYLKIYTGAQTAERILAEQILPLVQETDGLKCWFFIRYADPDFHLRLRLAGEPPLLAALLNQLQAALSPWAEDGRIAKIVADSYLPEQDRYGDGVLLGLTESLFQADSVFVASMAELLEGDEGEDLRWRLGLRSLHLLLEDAGLPMDERLPLLEHARRSWAAQIRVEKSTEAALNLLYRKESRSLEPWIAPGYDPDAPEAPFFLLLEQRSVAQRPIFAALRAQMSPTRFRERMGSYMHMAINRLARSDANRMEWVLYDFLLRLYKSAIARQNADSRRHRTE